jgi:hypothetical protein
LMNLTISGIKSSNNTIPTEKISKRKCNQSTKKKFKMPKKILKTKHQTNSNSRLSVSISEKFKNRWKNRKSTFDIILRYSEAHKIQQRIAELEVK